MTNLISGPGCKKITELLKYQLKLLLINVNLISVIIILVNHENNFI